MCGRGGGGGGGGGVRFREIIRLTELTLKWMMDDHNLLDVPVPSPTAYTPFTRPTRDNLIIFSHHLSPPPPPTPPHIPQDRLPHTVSHFILYHLEHVKKIVELLAFPYDSSDLNLLKSGHIARIDT